MTQSIGHRRVFGVVFPACILAILSSGMALGSNEGVEIFRQKRLLDRAQIFLDEGRQELTRGAYVRAIRVLSQAINKGADPEAFKLRGQAYDLIGEPEKALADFSSYVGAKGSDPEGYILRGDAYNSHHDSEKALADFTKAVELDSSSGDAYVGRGIAYLGLEEYELAVKEFRLALQCDPGNADALTDLGLAYMFAHRPEEAASYFEKALATEQDPRWKMRIAAWLRDLQPGSPTVVSAESPDRSITADRETESAIGEAAAEPGKKGLRHLKQSIARLPSGSKAISGSWQGKYQGYNLSMQLQQSGRSITGVLRVKHPVGTENSFNFIGTFENGKVLASHVGGTSFRGRLTDENRLVGVLTTADGMKIPVDLSENQ